MNLVNTNLIIIFVSVLNKMFSMKLTRRTIKAADIVGGYPTRRLMV